MGRLKRRSFQVTWSDVGLVSMVSERAAWRGVVLVAMLFLLLPASGPALESSRNPLQSSASTLVLDVDRTTITADQALLFQAALRDGAGNPVSGVINWTVTNGSMEETGLFIPWSAGVVNVTAEHEGLLASRQVTVEPGRPVDLELSLSETPVAGAPFRLNAIGVDAKGNRAALNNVAWSINGIQEGVGSPVVVLANPGLSTIGMRLFDLEASQVVEVIPGDPVAIEFPMGMSMRSGQGLQLRPALVDANGFPMTYDAVGGLRWSSNHGVVDTDGVFFPTRPGVWNVTATSVSGNLSANGSVAVLPADAAMLDIELDGDPMMLRAGQSITLRALLSDSLGASAPVDVALSNWTIPSGQVAASDDGPVWTPADIGPVRLQVEDSGLTAVLDVNVVFGDVVRLEAATSHDAVTAGDDVVLTAQAVDEAGNRRPVNATWSLNMGQETDVVLHPGIAFLEPTSIGTWGLEATWLDASTNETYSTEWSTEVEHGRLASITFDLDANLVPADRAVDVSPLLADAYGHPIEGVALNWTVDGLDATFDLRTSGGLWAPTSLGGHVIRANADGVFGLVRLTVEPGAASMLDLKEALPEQMVAGVPVELHLDRVDLHGNVGPAVNVSTNMNASVLTLEPSTSGPGYWTMTPKMAGTHSISLQSDEAILGLDVVFEPGMAVRLFVEVDGRLMAQGETALVSVFGVDVHGNLVSFTKEDVTLSCNAGSVSHLVDATWVVDLRKSGTDRSCTAETTDGLQAQTWFEVESVLLGGALGSSNSVVSLGGVLLIGVLVLMVVLLRRQQLEDIENLLDEDQTDLVDDEGQMSVVELAEESPVMEDAKMVEPLLEPDVLSAMAQEATTSGVMQAIPGTEQGATGWYVDANATVQHWTVGVDGSWTKTQD